MRRAESVLGLSATAAVFMESVWNQARCMDVIFNSRLQADSLSFECSARAAFILSPPFPPSTRMEPSDPSKSSSVFEQPPRETEAHAARETEVPASTLA